MQAVRFDEYGGVDVLEVREVPQPEPAAGELLVRVKAASINPGEISIREGRMHEQWPATFPSGEGSDFAGEVVALGDGVDGFAVGDAVLGWTDGRASHAEFVTAPADQVVAKPDAISWEVAGAMYVAPMAAYASIQAIAPVAGETVVISGAAGGVGSVAVQLALATGATVIGLAGPSNQDWLASIGAVPVVYGDGQAGRIRAAAGGPIHALADTFGGGYADLAVELGVPRDRINTIIDFPAIGRLGIKGQGTSSVASAETLAELTRLAADGTIEIPIARTYPLAEVRAAYEDLAQRRTRGKIVLLP